VRSSSNSNSTLRLYSPSGYGNNNDDKNKGSISMAVNVPMSAKQYLPSPSLSTSVAVAQPIAKHIITGPHSSATGDYNHVQSDSNRDLALVAKQQQQGQEINPEKREQEQQSAPSLPKVVSMDNFLPPAETMNNRRSIQVKIKCDDPTNKIDGYKAVEDMADFQAVLPAFLSKSMCFTLFFFCSILLITVFCRVLIFYCYQININIR